ncbi:MAG: damage-inducible protein CinA [Flavobacteriales bacterium]|nr:damage-inducible protein CinA [Flavobacteriales bacterium]|tara:strand:+ start:1723 stop:2202 length:480 start_codon:yes stop_codon:yes gene_type:complete
MKILPKDLSKILLENKFTISVAESCSAGGISSCICSVPGSSTYFLGGIVAYSNLSKQRDLGVREEDIKKFSEVSDVVAKQMSLGVKRKFNSDFSISTTGYSGPDGLDVGKVFISISNPLETVVKKYDFKGSRQEITNQIIETSLQNLISEIKLFIFSNK